MRIPPRRRQVEIGMVHPPDEVVQLRRHLPRTADPRQAIKSLMGQEDNLIFQDDERIARRQAHVQRWTHPVYPKICVHQGIAIRILIGRHMVPGQEP